jgi:hypothetical protein
MKRTSISSNRLNKDDSSQTLKSGELPAAVNHAFKHTSSSGELMAEAVA